MTPYFFKQMRKRTSLCLVVVLTALAFSLALCMLQRSRDQMAARIEEVYDNLEVRCSVTNLTGTQSDQLNLPDWVLRLFDGEKTYGNFQDNDLFAPYVRDVQVRSTVYCTTPGDQDRLTLSGVTGLKADSSLLASSGCTVIWREGFGEDVFQGRGFSLLLPAALYDPAAEPEDELMLQGVVDCCFETADGLTVVDFKTDRVFSALEVRQRAEHYRPQLEAYSRALERVLEKKVVRRALYFLAAGETMEI